MAEENPFTKLFTKPATSVQLAILQPGLREAPINITLTHADPNTATYDCISYDRSRDYGTIEVSVDGQPLAVPKPLVSALRALRSPDRPRTLWADLLIGSSDEERSAQAAVMKTVVENADATIAWLRPGDAHTTAAFDVLQAMANRYQQACLHSNFPQNVSRATQKQMVDLMEYLRSKSVEGFQPSNKPVWQLVEKILSSAYFKSVQSIPDIVLAKKVVVASGPCTMSWADFVFAGRAAPFIMAQQLKLTVSEEQIKCFELVGSIEIAERRRREGETLELLPMMQSARDCSTSDLREIVFSMLPIITPSRRTSGNGHTTQPELEADFCKPTSQVFIDAARYIMHERQDLLLWWTERPPRGRRLKDLPSWVPDWSTPLPKSTVKVSPVGTNGMRAWWDHLSTPPKEMRVDATTKTLHLQAHALDRVLTVSPLFTEANCRRLCLTEWQALPTLPGESLDAKVQKMFRTLVLNQGGMGATMRENAAPPREMWTSFQSVLAEERILELMNCTPEELMTNPSLVERMRAHPDAALLGPQTGQSEAFTTLLMTNALGRRFFRTESGRTGMTAIETLPAGVEESEVPAPDFDTALANPLGRAMLSHFQTYLSQRDDASAAAGALGQALSGTLPGQAAPGVRAGDLVVALVGGFQPYVLRPEGAYRSGEVNVEEALEATGRYVYVGDCYVHGIMDGEPFKVKGWFGAQSWMKDVKLVDISIA